MCTDEYLSANGELAKKMVAACREGWQKYLESPEETNKAILKDNQQGMTMEALEFGVQQMKPLCLPEGTAVEDLGKMTSERWQLLVDQFAALLKLIDTKKVTAQNAFRQLD